MFDISLFQPLDGQAELKVTGYPPVTPSKQLKSKIEKLANNTGGKVVSVTADYVLVRFSSSTTAERYVLWLNSCFV